MHRRPIANLSFDSQVAADFCRHDRRLLVINWNSVCLVLAVSIHFTSRGHIVEDVFHKLEISGVHILSNLTADLDIDGEYGLVPKVLSCGPTLDGAVRVSDLWGIS